MCNAVNLQQQYLQEPEHARGLDYFANLQRERGVAMIPVSRVWSKMSYFPPQQRAPSASLSRILSTGFHCLFQSKASSLPAVATLGGAWL